MSLLVRGAAISPPCARERENERPLMTAEPPNRIVHVHRNADFLAGSASSLSTVLLP